LAPPSRRGAGSEAPPIPWRFRAGDEPALRRYWIAGETRRHRSLTIRKPVQKNLRGDLWGKRRAPWRQLGGAPEHTSASITGANSTDVAQAHWGYRVK